MCHYEELRFSYHGLLIFLWEISWTHRETIMAVSNLNEFLVNTMNFIQFAIIFERVI